MPPVMMTKVMPRASSQTKALLPRMLLMLDQVGKVEEVAEAIATTRTRTASAPRRCTWEAIRSPRVARGARALAVAGGGSTAEVIGYHAPGRRRPRSR